MAEQKLHRRSHRPVAQAPRLFQDPKQWEEADDLEEQDEELKSQGSKKSVQKKVERPKISKSKCKKAQQVQEYEKALIQLRKEGTKYCNPFERHRLNISIMKAIIMLKDAIEKDKDFVQVLRHMGCKTRMRVRNKTAARELFIVMLKYLEESILPTWMHERHKELLAKDDSKFDDYVNMEDNQM